MMDEDELLHLALADFMLTGGEASHSVRMALGGWRRGSIAGDWKKRLPLYLWITVRTA